MNETRIEITGEHSANRVLHNESSNRVLARKGKAMNNKKSDYECEDNRSIEEVPDDADLSAAPTVVSAEECQKPDLTVRCHLDDVKRFFRAIITTGFTDDETHQRFLHWLRGEIAEYGV